MRKRLQTASESSVKGGAKNPLIVLPDADPQFTVNATAESAFGCAGQRCLAASLALTVGEAQGWFTEAIADTATDRVVGNGLAEGVEMGSGHHLREQKPN